MEPTTLCQATLMSVVAVVVVVVVFVVRTCDLTDEFILTRQWMHPIW